MRAKKVFVLSDICKSVIEKNLGLANVHNIGCSLWSDQKLDILAGAASAEKTNKFGILKSDNPVKGTAQALSYCKANNIEPLHIGSPDYATFVSQLASCERFLFIPQVLETFSRVCAEAKMVNCSVATTPKMVGFFSEDYHDLSGIDLVDKIKIKIKNALRSFEETILED